MSTFKVGDRVRYMGYSGKGTGIPAGEHWNMEGYLGKYGTITEVTEYSGLMVTFAGGKKETIASAYLDAASTGPKVSLAEVVEFLRLDCNEPELAEVVEEHFTPKEAVTLKIEGTPEQVKAAQEAITALSNITVEEVK